MKTSDFDYYLPPEQIAQEPVEPRDAARLLVLHRAEGRIEHRHFRDIGDYLKAGDVLVLNQTRVIPARLHGRKIPTGGRVEFLLLRREGERTWRGLIGGKRIREGTRLIFTGHNGVTVEGTVIASGERAERVIRFDAPISPLLEKLGEVPLPPYIHRPLDDPERYQTIYAREPGSAAAPTAGLHFTPELLIALRRQGVQIAACTLHIGLDTFQPVQVEEIEKHRMHTERAILTAENARLINEAKLAGGRIVAVGTTSVRVLETAALRSAGIDDPYAEEGDRCPWRPVVAIDEATSLFIRPGYRFRAVDMLITNFHLPRSTLLMLVSAFAGRETILEAYRIAQQEGYRFYSFGDAMLLI
ncbi:MAG TPA: tRNA preQ1(34) S-adenosylmethionine ribosyltransferase-isomerase QueA [Chloroflexi bacterium]|nr:tRNA preQ1(34) S-adenosylmethionine ribosyltransferase-isomerase QueA [Chloroflexota bacterium]